MGAKVTGDLAPQPVDISADVFGSSRQLKGARFYRPAGDQGAI
jgi:hypothetical protein